GRASRPAGGAVWRNAGRGAGSVPGARRTSPGAVPAGGASAQRAPAPASARREKTSAARLSSTLHPNASPAARRYPFHAQCAEKLRCLERGTRKSERGTEQRASVTGATAAPVPRSAFLPHQRDRHVAHDLERRRAHFVDRLLG